MYTTKMKPEITIKLYADFFNIKENLEFTY